MESDKVYKELLNFFNDTNVRKAEQDTSVFLKFGNTIDNDLLLPLIRLRRYFYIYNDAKCDVRRKV